MQVGLVAEFEVPTKDFAKFISAARQELISVRENETGCLRFDVIVFDEEKGHGAFVEVFADQAAAERHRELPHFKEFFDSIEDINVKWTTNRGRAIE
jgi:autoinducer 2-degrading protein